MLITSPPSLSFPIVKPREHLRLRLKHCRLALFLFHPHFRRVLRVFLPLFFPFYPVCVCILSLSLCFQRTRRKCYCCGSTEKIIVSAFPELLWIFCRCCQTREGGRRRRSRCTFLFYTLEGWFCSRRVRCKWLCRRGKKAGEGKSRAWLIPSYLRCAGQIIQKQVYNIPVARQFVHRSENKQSSLSTLFFLLWTTSACGSIPRE